MNDKVFAEDYIQRLGWEWDHVEKQIDEIRKLKETNGMAWWKEYCRLKDRECFLEQEIEMCQRQIARMKGERYDHFDREQWIRERRNPQGFRR